MPNYSYERLQREIENIDAHLISKHNERFPEGSRYHFYTALRPCPFEGNIDKARVIILLANPHYQSILTSKDHDRIDGWGLWGLHPESAFSNWWRPRLKSFISDEQDEEEWKCLSNKIASYQAIAWASKNFYDCKNLPSKSVMAKILNSLARERPELVFIVMRQRSYWLNVLEGTEANIVFGKNPRCSYVTESNIIKIDDWNRIKAISS
jgi:hypothetical protein